MIISVCVGQNKQRSMCFFSVNVMTWWGSRMDEDMGCTGREGKNNGRTKRIYGERENEIFVSSMDQKTKE